MNPKLSLSPVSRIRSGIDIVDTYWGGFYRGGTYVVYGRSAAGRGLLALLVAAKGCEHGESVVLVSPARAKDLLIQASCIGFDIRNANRRGDLRIMRSPPLLGYRDDEDNVSQALGELGSLITSKPWDRVVVTDFMPFARFKSFEAFQLRFLDFLEEVGDVDSALLLGMPEPANDHSNSVIDFMSSRATASIHVSSNGVTDLSRSLSLLPHYGHATRDLQVEWDLAGIVDAAEKLTLERGRPRVANGANESTEPANVEASADRTRLDELLITETSFAEPDRAAASTGGHHLPAWRQNGRFVSNDRFRDLLHSRFEGRSEDSESFLLIALRMDHNQNGNRHPYTFDFVVDLVRDSIRDSDRALVDELSERIVICLSHSDQGESNQFFARVKENLRERIPDKADDFLHAVSAIVVPDGRPFGDEEEFLKFVFS